MKSSNNEITVHRNETFSIDRVVQNPDGSPYIVSKQLENPHLLLTVSSSKFQQNSKYELNYFLELFGPGAIPRFNLTNPIDLKSLKGADGNALFPDWPDDPIFVSNVKRFKKATDYAKSQGTYCERGHTGYIGNSPWILRSDTLKQHSASFVETNGRLADTLPFRASYAAVVPAIKINYEYLSVFQQKSDGKILFGKYPRDRVTDSSLTEILSGIVGTPADESNSWYKFNYEYFESDPAQRSRISSFYKDFTYDGYTYRAIYFTQYRPNRVDVTPAEHGSNSYQPRNGYLKSTIYYFKYQPITWSVLKYVDNSVLLLCDEALDNQAFASFSQLVEEKAEQSEGDEDYGFISYKDSNVKSWLNSTFLNTAFTESERNLLIDSRFYDERSGWYYENNKVFLITPDETELIPERVLNGPYLGMAYFDDVLCLIELDDAVFSITDADGNVEYRYAIHVPPEGELTESNVGTLKWVPYEFRFAHTFTKDVTCEWTPQTYLYSIQLVSGTTNLQYLRDACSSIRVEDRTGDKYALHHRLKARGFKFPEDFDIESHFRRFDVVIPILNPTKLSVLSNLEGVIQ